MKKFAMKKFSAVAASAALVVTSFAGLGATSAQAQWGRYYGSGHYGGYYGGRHYRHRNRVDVGDIIGTVLVVGSVAALINQVNQIGERDRNNQRYRDYDERSDKNGYDGDRYEGDRYDDRAYVPSRQDKSAPTSRQSVNDEGRAADACAWAAEGQAGRDAVVDRITAVRADGQGWRVDGSVKQSGRSDSFTCGYANGRVDFVQLAGK